MKTVAQVSKITGVSVRTLHHYDAIGLLRPTAVSDAGYRLYDDEALKRLQSILFFRQLQFPLKDICRILDNPDFDPLQALSQQIRLLEMQRDHLDTLICHARKIQNTGGTFMDFKPFDTAKIDEYAAQAKEKWGNTDAYQEYEARTSGQTSQALMNTSRELMEIFRQFGQIRHLSPDASQAQALVKNLQDFITGHYYTCTSQILKALGQMYTAGDSMTENIDLAGGTGTAEFVRKAIEEYCR